VLGRGHAGGAAAGRLFASGMSGASASTGLFSIVLEYSLSGVFEDRRAQWDVRVFGERTEEATPETRTEKEVVRSFGTYSQ